MELGAARINPGQAVVQLLKILGGQRSPDAVHGGETGSDGGWCRMGACVELAEGMRHRTLPDLDLRSQTRLDSAALVQQPDAGSTSGTSCVQSLVHFQARCSGMSWPIQRSGNRPYAARDRKGRLIMH